MVVNEYYGAFLGLLLYRYVCVRYKTMIEWTMLSFWMGKKKKKGERIPPLKAAMGEWIRRPRLKG